MHSVQRLHGCTPPQTFGMADCDMHSLGGFALPAETYHLHIAAVVRKVQKQDCSKFRSNVRHGTCHNLRFQSAFPLNKLTHHHQLRSKV
jgi:hypothetical protein